MGLVILILGTVLGFLLIRTPLGPAVGWLSVAAGVGLAHREGLL